ncbi:hypothetical protein K523DRAFT_322561 [Schizophyllum commune Tattone D]|nr:hypothetical protein K523DRAFT_322561 [Schizophyllum commune Tattone D]
MNDHVENARKVEQSVESRDIYGLYKYESRRARSRGACPTLLSSIPSYCQGQTTTLLVTALLVRKSSITSITLPIVPGEATRRTIRAGDSGKQLYEGVLCRNGYRKKKKRACKLHT